MVVKPTQTRLGLDHFQDIIMDLPNINAAMATDGVQYSAIATVGTTAVAVYSEVIDPGFSMQLLRLKPALAQRFTGLNGSYVGSLMYYWEARSEGRMMGSGGVPIDLTGAWVNLTGTYQAAAGTLTTADDVFSGHAQLGSLPIAPVRLRLTVAGIQAAIVTAKVKNSSYVQMVGNVIPGV